MIETLLWVEDDSNDILLGRRAMVKAGIPPPQVVRDGRDAMAYLAGQGPFADRSRHPLPGLILMDLKLPKLSGLEVLRWLKSRPGLRRIPTIILTSSRETADVNAAYDLGANAYLLKAVHFNDLVETLGLFRSFWLELNRSPVASGADESDR